MNLFGMTRDQILHLVRKIGAPDYRADQIAEWLYKRHAESHGDMNNLPKGLREKLAGYSTIRTVKPEDAGQSHDGTRKYVWPSFGGDIYESALIPERKRLTLCVSSQAGCRIGCKFCLTARKGLKQNLSTAEILSQFGNAPERDEITHVVYMGMGEPLDNLDAVLDSLQILTSSWGYGLSPRRVTVSTIGLLPQLERLLDETQANVAVSLHAARREVRLPLVPSESRHPIRAIVDLLHRRVELALPPFTGTGRRRVSFEITMLSGVNDSTDEAEDLRDLIAGIPARVNLIPWNPFPGAPFQPSSRGSILAYQSVLKRAGIMTTIRESRGQDIGAACGLLAGRRETAAS
ncbi:MAG: 23S rRNA (adenine(2503)-C(2))-methyltransferase RlmN [Spirochaetaceae bacterium]|nr:23S rRNA (adenine(2503)-C(2))-methyltransferase RlmN [Spirochaetaceae bacterium]